MVPVPSFPQSRVTEDRTLIDVSFLHDSPKRTSEAGPTLAPCNVEREQGPLDEFCASKHGRPMGVCGRGKDARLGDERPPRSSCVGSNSFRKRVK